MSGDDCIVAVERGQIVEDGMDGARIALDRDWMETENGRILLGPGMAVDVEINTGRRSIISYLLSPLATRVQESLHER